MQFYDNFISCYANRHDRNEKRRTASGIAVYIPLYSNNNGKMKNFMQPERMCADYCIKWYNYISEHGLRCIRNAFIHFNVSLPLHVSVSLYSLRPLSLSLSLHLVRIVSSWIYAADLYLFNFKDENAFVDYDLWVMMTIIGLFGGLIFYCSFSIICIHN